MPHRGQVPHDGAQVPLMEACHLGDHGDQGPVLDRHHVRQAGHGFRVKGFRVVEGNHRPGRQDGEGIRLHIEKEGHISLRARVGILTDGELGR